MRGQQAKKRKGNYDPTRWADLHFEAGHTPPGHAIDALPCKYRHLWNLVDGQRGANEIGHLLNGAPDQLLAILNDLEARHLIVMSQR